MNELDMQINKIKQEENKKQMENEKALINSLNDTDKIYFNFSYTALKMLGRNLYNNPWSAIAELVANSFDAKAEEIYVYFEITDKKHATVEIIDNGKGMNYSDLAEKYVWVGRNKREDQALPEEEKKNMMGRKGIGKLAALYLTNKYYLFSKQKGSTSESKWVLNMDIHRDSDFPRLDRLAYNVELDSKAVWKEFSNGTALRLVDIDLSRLGDKRIEGFKRTLADYYLLEYTNSKIYFAIKEKTNQAIVFKEIEKGVAYKNFYAVFDNSSLEIGKKMLDSMCFPSTFEHIAKIERTTIELKSNNFTTCGSSSFVNEKGDAVKKDYRLSGWIAIHSSIEMKTAKDPKFIRNDSYQPNKLRIYVRNKLALGNYFDMHTNTQAMSNYIEGEISFDILDDNDLPDIATSSRQDFLADERVELLIKIVDPIINSLIKERIAIGRDVKKEENEYIEEIKRLEDEEKKKEREARIKAEEAEIEAEKRRQVEYASRIAAEKREAEERQKREEAENIASTEKKKAYFLEGQLTDDKKVSAYNTHVIKNNASRISDNVLALITKHVECKDYKEIKATALASNKILVATKYFQMAGYDFARKKMRENIVFFICDYIKSVISKEYYNLKISIENGDSEFIQEFPPQDLTLMIDNIFSNADKAKSKTVQVSFKKVGSCLKICFINDGETISDNVDKSRLFEFGYSVAKDGKPSDSTGVGLYQISDLIRRKQKGKCSIFNNSEKGVTLEIKLYES